MRRPWEGACSFRNPLCTPCASSVPFITPGREEAGASTSNVSLPKDPSSAYFAAHFWKAINSVALVLEVLGHNLDLIGTTTVGLEVLLGRSAVILNTWLILGEKSDNKTSGGLHDGSTTTLLGELSEASGRVMRNKHVLLTTDTDTSFSWLSVAVGGTQHAIPLVDVVGLGVIGGHSLNSDLSLLVKIWEAWGPVPAGTILAVDSGLIDLLLP